MEYVFREVMRRDEEACELRSDILRKNALIADLTLMNERLSVGKDKELITSDLEGQRSSLPTSDGALELELAQTKVRDVIISRVVAVGILISKNFAEVKWEKFYTRLYGTSMFSDP